MRDHLERFGDAVVVVVTFAPAGRLAAYREHLAVPFPILTDPDLRLYHLLGAKRAPFRDVWSVGTFRLYVRLIRKGRRLRKPAEDINQLGADAVIGRDGRLRYLSLPTSPDRRPPIDQLIAALD